MVHKEKRNAPFNFFLSQFPTQIDNSVIHEIGVIVKDLDIGLCDFPYLMEDRIVYLCWKLGEKKIEWWHEVHSGYSGRHPLPPDAT